MSGAEKLQVCIVCAMAILASVIVYQGSEGVKEKCKSAMRVAMIVLLSCVVLVMKVF